MKTCKVEIVKLRSTTAKDPEPKFRVNGLLCEGKWETPSQHEQWVTPFEAEGGLDGVLKLLKDSKAELRSFRAVLVWENYGDETDEKAENVSVLREQSKTQA